MNDKPEFERRLIKLRNLITQLNTLLLSCLNLRKNETFSEGMVAITKKILETRRLVVIEIGPTKAALDIPIDCPERENAELNRLKQLAIDLDMQVSAEEIEVYFAKIFREAKLIQAAKRLEGQPRLMK